MHQNYDFQVALSESGPIYMGIHLELDLYLFFLYESITCLLVLEFIPRATFNRVEQSSRAAG